MYESSGKKKQREILPRKGYIGILLLMVFLLIVYYKYFNCYLLFNKQTLNALKISSSYPGF